MARSFRLRRVLFSTAALAVAQFQLVLPAVALPLTAVISSPGNLQIKLEPIVTLNGFVPIDAATIPGNSNLYVGTYVASTARVQTVDPIAKTVSATPFLAFAGTGVPITGQGLQGIAFSPNFDDNTQPGYRKFYTYEAETGPVGANVMFLHPEVANPSTVGVVREWTANAAGTSINTSIASRIVFNFGTPAGHMGGGMKFGPDGYLYLATGDGGGNGDGGSTSNNNDGFTGRNPAGTSTDVPGISNGQDFTNVLGKVIRIDPYVTNADGAPRATPLGVTAKVFGGSTRYFIPDSNPFVGNSQNIFFTPIGPATDQTPVAPLAELFAFGFRNPWKLSFDKNAVPGDLPYVADVGSRQREEINRVQPGSNYGWPYREGDIVPSAANGRPLNSNSIPYLKHTSPGVFAQFDLNPALSDPAQMALPTALLGTRSGTSSPLVFADRPANDIDGDGIYGNSYGDTDSVVGGFVYRGTKIPELAGKYVFGGYELLVIDPARDPNTFPAISGGGRLFYFDPTEAGPQKTIREFNLLAGSAIAANDSGNILSIVQADDGELYVMFANGDIKQIVRAPLEGDYNNDNVVDAADYIVWRHNFGSTTANLPNDPTPAVVDATDYDMWRTNFGAVRALGGSASESGLSTPMPETTTLQLLALRFLSGVGSRRRKRQTVTSVDVQA